MNGFGYIFTFLTAGLLWALPRRLAPVALLVGTAYITINQQIGIGPLHFPLIRILIAVGLLRVLARGERIDGPWNLIDRLMLIWAIWATCSLAFHKSTIWVTRLGQNYDTVGSYLLFRIFIHDLDDLRQVFKQTCILIMPLALLMLVEKVTGHNPLSRLGFTVEDAELRNGYFRAQGAFAHSILAGTLGAVCLPIGASFWQTDRRLAFAGLGAAAAIVFASSSSGPIMTAFVVIAGLAFWRYRQYLGPFRWLTLLLLIALDLVMNDPVYFLMARIDIAGGSTGYFRAQLIRSAIQHLNEWWLAGTDYTRHWMASGIAVNADHTDMTNYYIQMGVWGGLPLMLLFMAILVAGFVVIGRALRAAEDAPVEQQFLIWCLGCILFGHATTFVSISYFDQSIVFLSFALACVGALHLPQEATVPAEDEDVSWSTPGYETTGHHSD